MMQGPITLKSTAQDVTAAWADLGAEIKTSDYKKIGLWLTIDINDSTDFRIRALAKHTAAGSQEYLLPIKTVSASDVKVEGEYIELNKDEDQLMLLSVDLDELVPVVQFQIQAAVPGASAGQVDAAYYTLVGGSI